MNDCTGCKWLSQCDTSVFGTVCNNCCRIRKDNYEPAEKECEHMWRDTDKDVVCKKCGAILKMVEKDRPKLPSKWDTKYSHTGDDIWDRYNSLIDYLAAEPWKKE